MIVWTHGKTATILHSIRREAPVAAVREVDIMRNNRNFRTWVVAAVASWVALAGAFAISAGSDAASASAHSVATAFPSAEAGVALRAVHAGG
jgi:hypothetical protein